MTHANLEPLETARVGLFEINRKIVNGDICNPRFVLKSKQARQLIEAFHDDCTFAGIKGAYAALFISASGLLSMQYSFNMPDGATVSGYITANPPKTDE